MQCDELYLSLLSGHVDGINSSEEEKLLQAHLESCAHCRDLLSRMEQNDALLAQSALQPPADLTDRIMASIRKEPKKRRKRFWISTTAAGLATAALLSFALLGDKLPKLPDTASVETTTAPADTALVTGSDSSGENAEDTQLSLPQELETLPSAELKAPPAYDGQGLPDGSNFDIVPPEEKSVLAAPQPPQAVYGAIGDGDAVPDQSGKSERNPMRREFKLPTLVLWNVTQEELFTILGKEPTPLEQFSGNSVAQNSPYHGFLSGLPLSEQLLSMHASPSRGQDVEKPDAAVDVYQISYDELCDLFTVLGGSVELSLYFPDHYTDAENCQLIVIHTNF